MRVLNAPAFFKLLPCSDVGFAVSFCDSKNKNNALRGGGDF